jgi:hypothetical protein
MEDNKPRIFNVSIFYSTIGLVSVFISYIVANTPSSVNVHSGEIFIWILILLIFSIIIPTILLIKSVRTLTNNLAQAKTNVKTYSIISTIALGVSIALVIITLIWTILK